jgi:hypothetical protein
MDDEDRLADVSCALRGRAPTPMLREAVSEWVLAGLQCWRRASRHSRGDKSYFDPGSGASIR